MLIVNVAPLHSGLFLSAWTQFLKMVELFPFLIVGFIRRPDVCSGLSQTLS